MLSNTCRAVEAHSQLSLFDAVAPEPAPTQTAPASKPVRRLRAVPDLNTAPSRRDVIADLDVLHELRIITLAQWRIMRAIVRSRYIQGDTLTGRISYAELQEVTGYSERMLQYALNGRPDRDQPGILSDGYKSLNLMAREGFGRDLDGSNQVPLYYINWKLIGELARTAKAAQVQRPREVNHGAPEIRETNCKQTATINPELADTLTALSQNELYRKYEGDSEYADRIRDDRWQRNFKPALDRVLATADNENTDTPPTENGNRQPYPVRTTQTPTPEHELGIDSKAPTERLPGRSVGAMAIPQHATQKSGERPSFMFGKSTTAERPSRRESPPIESQIPVGAGAA